MDHNIKNHNCIICADEFSPDTIENLSLIKINSTNFKICLKCLNNSDPSNDFEQVKKIISSYEDLLNIYSLFKEAKDILHTIDIKV